ncbi:MAG: tyrosine-type recombinase/integrase [Acidimicrobiia bacterium]
MADSTNRRTRGTGSIRKRKAATAKPWEARYRGPDGRSHSKTFARKTDAEKWLRREIGKVERAEWTDPRAGRTTVAEVAETWFAGVQARDTKPKTVAGYRNLLDSRVLPVFGDYELRHVTSKAVREWLEEMAREGLSGARARAALQVLGAVMRRAVKDELIPRNPIDKLDATDKPTVRRRRQLFINDFEVKALADAAAERHDGAGMLIRFFAYSGCRWGEATALRVGDIEANGSGKAKVHVERAYSDVRGKLVLGEPKTHERRVVILPAWVSRMMFDHIEGKSADELVFTTPTGRPLRSSNFRRAVWAPACEASKMPEGLMIHDLRDTAASLATRSGAPLLAVSRMLGHRDASITATTYASLFDEDLELLADRWDAATPREVKGSAG